MDCWTNRIPRSLIDFIHYSKTYYTSRGSMQMLKCLCAFYTIIALGTQFQFYLLFTSSMINKQMGHINCTKYYVIMYTNIRHLYYFIFIPIKMGENFRFCSIFAQKISYRLSATPISKLIVLTFLIFRTEIFSEESPVEHTQRKC